MNADGSQADSTVLPLKSLSHIARLLGGPQQLFPAIADFRGTLWVHSSSPIAALVLRLYQEPSKLCYTSLPVVSQSSAQLGQKLPQVANGNFDGMSFKSSFLVFNISSSAADVTLAVTQNDGSPLTVTIPGTGTDSTFHFTLAARASVILQTDGLGPGKVGAATLTSSVPVGASAVFTLLDTQGRFKTEAGVGDSAVLTSLTVPVDVTGQFETGVAFLNPTARCPRGRIVSLSARRHYSSCPSRMRRFNFTISARCPCLGQRPAPIMRYRRWRRLPEVSAAFWKSTKLSQLSGSLASGHNIPLVI